VGVSRCPNFWVPPIILGTGKATDLNFVGTFIGSIGTKAHEKCWDSSRGHSQGAPKFFRAPMYGAHCAVIIAIAQLSCYRGCNGGLSGSPSSTTAAMPTINVSERMVTLDGRLSLSWLLASYT